MNRHACWLVSLAVLAGAKAESVWKATAVRQLTFGEGVDSEAAWAPDGRFIAFQRQEGFSLKLMRLELATGKLDALAGDAAFRACYPAWTPEGGLVYSLYDCSQTAAEAFRAGSDRGCNLVMRAPDGKTRELTRGRWRDYTPSVSRDGRFVYYATTFGMEKGFDPTGFGCGASLARIGLAPGAKAEPVRTYSAKKVNSGGVSPELSPDGQILAWAEMPGYNQFWRLVTAPVTNPAAARAITPEGMSAYSPRWAPDGRHIAFTGFREGDPGWSLYLVDVATLGLSRLEVGQGSSKSPAWAPDGKRLVFENNRAGRYQLYSCALVEQPKLFEVMALVDHYDWGEVPDQTVERGRLFDVETTNGCRTILDSVLETGAPTVLWRQNSGSVPRYHIRAEAEAGPSMRGALDKRRLPLNLTPVSGWHCMSESKEDLLGSVLAEIKARGCGAGLHWPFEETHWSYWTYGAWNYEHPQYWGRDVKGKRWAGRCSLAYPEVFAHRMRLADEMIALGAETILVDCCRNGGWTPAYEYVQPELDRWRARYGEPPPKRASDPRWCAFLAERTTDYFRSLRGRLRASGRPIRLLLMTVSMNRADQEPDRLLIERGIDWKRLVDERIVDGLFVKDVAFDVKRPFESTLGIYQSYSAYCKGKCDVYFPLESYNYSNRGMPAYQKATGLRQHQVAEKLIGLAKEAGGAGVVLEVVDYRSYTPETCKLLKEMKK